MLSSLILFEGTRRLSVLFSCAFCSSSRFTISCSRLMSEPADFRNSALMLHSWREALQTDVLLWVIKECIIYCITLMPFDLLKLSSTYRSPRSLRTAVIGIRHIWKFSCPLYNTGLVQGFSFPAKIKIKWQSNKWMQFAEFSPNIMISPRNCSFDVQPKDKDLALKMGPLANHAETSCQLALRGASTLHALLVHILMHYG